jgi:hypothetical protein
LPCLGCNRKRCILSIDFWISENSHIQETLCKWSLMAFWWTVNDRWTVIVTSKSQKSRRNNQHLQSFFVRSRTKCESACFDYLPAAKLIWCNTKWAISPLGPVLLWLWHVLTIKP